MTSGAEQGALWEPTPQDRERANMTRFMRWVGEREGREFEEYEQLWRWSVTEIERFWAAIWEFCGVRASRPYERVLKDRAMPGARWFEGVELNYAENMLLRERDAEAVAVLHCSELRPLAQITWGELAREVAQVAAGLRALGVERGDRVVAYMPNLPETLIAFLATASIGAIFSSAAPEFGARSVIDRFAQIEPKVLLAVDGYRHGGKDFDRRAALGEILAELPTVRHAVLLPYLFAGEESAAPREGESANAREGREADAGESADPRERGSANAREGREADAGESADPRERGSASAGEGLDASAGEVQPPPEWPGALTWAQLRARGEGAELSFEQVPFDHPLWVLYSSGTTGLPKALVHGHGGMLLEQLKKGYLHLDLHPGDRMFWFTTTGWMMWNFLVGCLFTDAAIVLYDGSPSHPDLGALWSLAERTGMTCMGLSAGLLAACEKDGVEPARDYDLSALRAIGSTGSPLAPESFDWVYGHVGRAVWLFSTSGGTDVCTAFVGGCPLLPVYSGELQCRVLGCAVEAWDSEGRSVVDEVGELVLTQPMPSMPLYLWGDGDGARRGGVGERYRESYFSTYPGVWRHGDWIRITPRGGAVIYGRSDATINRQGVRMGTSEIYRAAGAVKDVVDALVVDVPSAEDGGELRMMLFVVLRPGVTLDERLEGEIKRRIRVDCSPRHVPNEVRQIAEVPRTLSGKALEVPVKRILMGAPPQDAASVESLANPDALSYFVDLARSMR